jgi:hypothetical protein
MRRVRWELHATGIAVTPGQSAYGNRVGVIAENLIRAENTAVTTMGEIITFSG